MEKETKKKRYRSIESERENRENGRKREIERERESEKKRERADKRETGRARKREGGLEREDNILIYMNPLAPPPPIFPTRQLPLFHPVECPIPSHLTMSF